ncbi:MAG: DUF4292 domain-containing protein [Bacteroidales bacterium]
MSTIIRGIFLSVLIAVVCISCSSTKQFIQRKTYNESDFTKITDTLTQNYKKINTFYGRFSGTIKLPDNEIESKGTIRIQKDSIIWISLKPFLIEVARCAFTPDSVFIINKLEKSYYAGNYSYIQDFLGIPIDYTTIQSIILNNIWEYPLHPDSTIVHEQKIKNRKNELIKVADSEQFGKKYAHQSITISKENINLTQIDIKDYTQNKNFAVNYSNFTSTSDSIYFPYTTSIKIKEKNNNILINIDYLRINLNTKQSYPFSINPKYTPWQ